MGLKKNRLSASLLWVVALLISPISSASGARLAIIIDDMGHNLKSGSRALALQGAITYAFLPRSPYATLLARKAHNKGKEVMLHNPMEPVGHQRVDPGVLTKQMNKQEFVAILHKNIAQVPFLSGVNNHMGSLLTQNVRQMTWLMDELKQQKLYFIDSRTTAATVAEKVARNHNIPTARRDVFLDYQKNNSVSLASQFKLLIRLAKKRGQALGIAHPYSVTLTFLENQLPMLTQLGVELVFVSSLVDPGPQHKTQLTRVSQRLQ